LIAQLSAGQPAVRLLPAGKFRSAEGSGRPHDAPAWRMDAETAAILISQDAARANRRVVDYEHQTLSAASNGQPAPAAGWIEALEWRDDGLYAGIAWTPKAAAMIDDGEYRYLSPVFSYDATGRVLDILHAGITNHPGLDGLTD
jgi:phage I-like protein